MDDTCHLQELGPNRNIPLVSILYISQHVYACNLWTYYSLTLFFFYFSFIFLLFIHCIEIECVLLPPPSWNSSHPTLMMAEKIRVWNLYRTSSNFTGIRSCIFMLRRWQVFSLLTRCTHFANCIAHVSFLAVPWKTASWATSWPICCTTWEAVSRRGASLCSEQHSTVQHAAQGSL